MKHRRRVVITGMGIVTPLASDLDVFWEKVLAGHSAVNRIRRFDVSAYPTQVAAEVVAFRSHDHRQPGEWPDAERIEQFALSAAWSALEDSGWRVDHSRGDRAGVVLAAGAGTYTHQEFLSSCSAAGTPQGPFDWSAFLRQYQLSLGRRAAERCSPGNIAVAVARRFRLTGPVMAVMMACSAGTQAVGDATRWIRRGTADLVLAGGSDSELYPMGLSSFCLLRALSTRNSSPSRASRPFDAGRDGFVLGEGAGVLVLENLERARARGARIYAEIVGFGSACDGYRVTDPHPEGKGAIPAMQRALRDAEVGPQQVDYINAHGTSTRVNDRVETLAIKTVFQKHAYRLAVSSTKSMIGHLTNAAGAVETIVTALTLRDERIHPTINYEVPDPECDLDYVPNRARRIPMEHAVSNSFAFGGQCASLLLRKYSD